MKALKLNIPNETLSKFQNFENISYFGITLFNKMHYLKCLIPYFKNLETLTIEKGCNEYLITKDNTLIFPQKLTSLNFEQFSLEEINSILSSNKKSLPFIKNFSFNVVNDELKNFKQLIYYYFLNFKSLKTIEISLGNETDFIWELLSIYKIIPSLVDLKIITDIYSSYAKRKKDKYGYTYYEESLFEKLEKEAKNINTKNLINLNIVFSDCICIIKKGKVTKIIKYSMNI